MTDAEINSPDIIEKDLRWIIETAIDAHPRSQQKLIGPSEIGVPCDRALANKLAGTPEPPRSAPAWKPTVGTAVHAWLEQAFATFDTAYTGRGEPSRFSLEQRVVVGQIGGKDIAGSCDLFDHESRWVIDWKCVGPSRLAGYRRKGPGRQYRAQAHLYGRGWQAKGETPGHVGVFFLPRDGELRDGHLWSEPYDEQVALDALKRADDMHALVSSVGLEAALSLYEPCSDQWCPWCGIGKPFERTGGSFFNPQFSPPNPTNGQLALAQ